MACGFDGFGGNAKLAEVATQTVGYFGCAPARHCVPTKLATGDAMVVYRVDGDWTCGYLLQRDGAGPGWAKSRDIREIRADPAPPLNAWSGAWVNGYGRIVVAASNPPGKLHLEGTAEWHGKGDVVHTGSFSGDAAPDGNHVHIAEGGADSCAVDLTLIGKYMVGDDNNKCGGMNVRFWGVWKRGR